MVGHVELVPVAVVGGPLLALEVDLPDREPGLFRREPVKDRPDFTEQAVDVGVAPVVDVIEGVVLAQVLVPVPGSIEHRVGPVQRVLHRKVAGIETEAVHPPAQPEAERVEHRRPGLVVAPVDVGLFGQEGMEVVLAGVLVEGPGRAAEDRDPVVGRRAVGCRVLPHVPVALGVVTGGPGLQEPAVLG